jgi:peptidoglycan hydrolase-like protein with peptidoglycan-binding domain
MDDFCAYQTELAKPTTKRNAIAGGVVAAVVAIFAVFAFSNVSGSSSENSASKDEVSTLPQPVEAPAATANSTQPVEAPATTANSTQPVDVPTTMAKSTQPVEAPATSATSTQPVEVPTATQPVQSSKRASMSKKGITQMQARLGSLGYLSVSPTGTFGPKTRAALRAFKATNGLPKDEVWDDETKIRLSSKKAIRVPAHVADAVKRR